MSKKTVKQKPQTLNVAAEFAWEIEALGDRDFYRPMEHADMTNSAELDGLDFEAARVAEEVGNTVGVLAVCRSAVERGIIECGQDSIGDMTTALGTLGLVPLAEQHEVLGVSEHVTRILRAHEDKLLIEGAAIDMLLYAWLLYRETTSADEVQKLFVRRVARNVHQLASYTERHGQPDGQKDEAACIEAGRRAVRDLIGSIKALGTGARCAA